MSSQSFRIAIDGPSGTGKSSVSRQLAQHFQASYLDTGAMYRIATLFVMKQGIDVGDAVAVAAATEDLPLKIASDPLDKAVYLAGEDVSTQIRSRAVTDSVSAVAAVSQVRDNLVNQQRRVADSAEMIVMEGRDIGTEVLPDAELKVFLIADAQVRAQRRYDQEIAAGKTVDFDEILASIKQRDHVDSTREDSPLRPAENAIIVDTSALTQAEVLAHLVQLVEERK